MELFFLSPYGQWALVAAFFMDMVLGDPVWLPHPIRWIGSLIERGEAVARRLPLPEFFQGMLLVLMVLVVVGGTVGVMLRFVATISWWVEWLLSVVVLYYGLSLRCLAREVAEVGKALQEMGVEAARKRLSYLVGRDTSKMDEAQILMAAIETAAENLVDGFTSPFFYACIGGPVGIMLYKAVNTMDSMIGYLDHRYRRFGTFAARLDDVANFVPARLTLYLLSVGAVLQGRNPFSFIRAAFNEAKKHSSPNSGLCEAAFASLLSVKLGGPAVYGGRRVEREFIFPENSPPTRHDLDQAVRLLYGMGSAFCGLALCVGMLVGML